MNVTFRITNSINNQDTCYCEVNAKVKEEIYDKYQKNDKLGNTYYYVSYEYTYGTDANSKKCHPFWNNRPFYEHSEGDIIIKNEVNEKLIKYLLMDMDSLETVSGSGTPEHYKKIIMMQIALAFD